MSHHGLKREEAYRNSVSRAKALGTMQFTNRRGNGTCALVVRRCPGARIDPSFERGATNLLNAMKAAICLFDIELYPTRREIREPYRSNPEVLGIFPVAAYNGGPRNVTRLYGVITRMGITRQDLRTSGEPLKSSLIVLDQDRTPEVALTDSTIKTIDSSVPAMPRLTVDTATLTGKRVKTDATARYLRITESASASETAELPRADLKVGDDVDVYGTDDATDTASFLADTIQKYLTEP